VGVRLIAGRAGSGKTVWCQSQVCEALASSLVIGPRLVMLVPEQAALQMERGLLARSTASALGRCEVLSFRRLAHRILNETTGPMPATLSPTGRHMALRHLILRHRKDLREFAKVAERGGFVAAIARGITELLQEAVTTGQLDAAARDAQEAGDPSAPRLHDAALLYRAYLDYLGSQRVDPEGVLDLARARLASVPWLDGARIWLDGFAGLTRQQVRMIVALAQRASHVDIALLLDPTRGRARDVDAEPDDLSLFARTQRTWFQFARALHDAGVPIEEPISLGQSDCPRFRGAGTLARLERELFTVPALPREICDTGAPPVSPPPRRRGHNDCCVRLVKAPDRRAEVAAAVRTLVDLIQRPAGPCDANVRAPTTQATPFQSPRQACRGPSSASRPDSVLAGPNNAPMRYRDVAIIVRDLGPYHDLISASLRTHDIPFFIDRRRPTHHHPLVQSVRGALAMHAEGPFDQAVTFLLKSGLSGLEDEAADALENYLLAQGLVSAEAWDEPWTHPAVTGRKDQAPSAAARAALEAVNQSRDNLRRRIGAWWPAEAARRGRPACRKWVERLYALLENLGAADRLAAWCDEAVARGELDEAEEHQQVWSDLVKLLDELVETLGDERMTGRQFRDVLESGLSQFTLGLVPATVDQVLVGSIERSRHPPVRAVFLLGFEDGRFPARLTEDTILGDQERARLDACGAELGRTQAQRLLDERMLAYIAVTRPSEFLWVSYPESDEAGRRISPSPYWASLRAVLPEVPVETAETNGPAAISAAGQLATGLASSMRAWCEQGSGIRGQGSKDSRIEGSKDSRIKEGGSDAEDSSFSLRSFDPSILQSFSLWLALYDWARSAESVSAKVRAALSALQQPPEARLSAAATAALWRPPHRISVTRLEQFAACPFQHFVANGLGLTPRARHEISPLDMGSLYHTILEQFVNELIESGTNLREMSPEQIAENLSRLTRTLVPAFAERVRMEAWEQVKAVWRGGVELPAAVGGERQAIGETPLRPVATERSFGTQDPHLAAGLARRVDEADALPALELKTPAGQVVQVRGKIDRVDVLQAGDVSLAVVLDYKRSIGQRLRLDEVYHGLALQLLAYLLVIRDHGDRLTGARLVPGGAFYLPLLGSFEKMDHPDDADEETFNPYKAYKPRGIIDFDWIDRLDANLESGWSSMFSVYRKKDGEIGQVDKSDAVTRGMLPTMLDHVRRKMTELAEDWLSGNVAVAPARLGRHLPCSRCRYRAVCRFEFVTRQTRSLAPMSRSHVLDELAGQAGGHDG
jgi:ATP-dependent helicase/nuclease subunit B